MSDQFVDAAKERMGAIERLLKGLPGIESVERYDTEDIAT